jgi:hypothetical protein
VKCMYVCVLHVLSYILIPIILHTYLNYPTYVSQFSYISCHLSHLSATCEAASNLSKAAGNTTCVVYVCSVCDKSFGDIHSSCAKHVNGRGACKEKGAVVLPGMVPLNA